MKTFEEFVKDIIPNIDKRYEFYKLCQKDENIIGMKVMAIRAGFSCSSEGGTKMTIESIDPEYIDKWGNKIRNVHLKPNKDSHESRNGWGCTLNDLPHSVIPY